MGSLPRPRVASPRLTDDQIVAEYAAGEGLAMLGLRARLPTATVRAILVARGVRIRGQAETLRLTLRARTWQPLRLPR
jgi:hypothetical protein